MLNILWAKVQALLWRQSRFDMFDQKRDRIPLLLLIIGIQSLYFPLNRTGTSAARVDLSLIDGVMPLIGPFVVPYLLGFILISTLPLIAVLVLPRRLFQQFTIAYLCVMLLGFFIWSAFPAYVYKAPFQPVGIFEEWTQDLHERDQVYGNHNAIPSSHVYYITVGLYFFAKRWPRHWFLFASTAVINVWSTLFTHQHYFLDVLSGLVLTIFGIWVARHVTARRMRSGIRMTRQREVVKL